MSAEEDLYGLASQDMPVTGDEVREAMNAYAHELAEKIRPEGPEPQCCMLCEARWTARRDAAEEIDPEVLNSGGGEAVRPA